MKTILPFIFACALSLQAFSQEINLEFSLNIQNAGDPSVKTKPMGEIKYGPDRSGSENCALSLDAETKGAVRLNNMNSFDFTAPFTISIWFRTYNNAKQQYLFTKGENRNPVSEDFSISVGQGVMTGGFTLPDYQFSSQTNPTKWYNYVMVHEEDSIYVYLNNEFQTKSKLNVTTTASDTALIGLNFSGEIDQFKFFSYPVNRNQITGLFEATPVCNLIPTSIADNDVTDGTLAVAFTDGNIALANTSKESYTWSLTSSIGSELSSGSVKELSSIKVPVSCQGLVILHASNGKHVFSRKIFIQN